jgi:hypothetical protein
MSSQVGGGAFDQKLIRTPGAIASRPWDKLARGFDTVWPSIVFIFRDTYQQVRNSREGTAT